MRGKSSNILNLIFHKNYFLTSQIKFCLMIGFDIVKLGKMLDDREFYAKNNAGETMNAIWPSAHPGKTNHEDYAWDMPEVLQRPQGGEYVYHTDIFLMSANDMVNKPVRTAPFPTAQSYLDMGHAKGSREDIQSLVALCFIVIIYAYREFQFDVCENFIIKKTQF